MKALTGRITSEPFGKEILELDTASLKMPLDQKQLAAIVQRRKEIQLELRNRIDGVVIEHE
jgi:hypothetical protein